jgi:hypothetical protein
MPPRFEASSARERLGVALAALDSRHPALTSIIDPRAGMRRRRFLEHRHGRTAPDSLVVPDATPSPTDVANAQRLLAAYQASVASSPTATATHADLWTLIAAEEQQDFLALLASGDAERLAACLCNVSRHSASHGIAQGHREHARIVRDRRYRDFVGRLAHDKLVLLAEAVGVLPPDNPEQGDRDLGIGYPPDVLVERIEANLGMSIAPPGIDGGMLKLRTSSGLFGERDLNAIYTAHLLTQHADAPQTSVCEIGGGTGRVAYWARRMGFRSYTIVDLPLVNVVQGFYALSTMPPEEVVLYGERPAGDALGCLQILPPHAVDELGDTPFDLFLNQDSMPEMSADIATDYLRWISRVCQGTFVSINHETKPAYGDGLVHVNVAELAGAVGGLVRGMRYQYWLRRGYVVETYRPSPGRAPADPSAGATGLSAAR